MTLLCGLKYTKVRLKYYKENTINIYVTIQQGIRGWLASVLGNYHVKYRNKQIDPEYTGEEKYLKYLDFNSLYASAMVQALPSREIKVCDSRNGFADDPVNNRYRSRFGDVFFKLMNNAFYEKTIENVYNRQVVEIVNEVDRYIKLVKNISFKYAVEFDDDLVAVHKTRTNVKLYKFNYIGFVILEKAKLFMYKAIYEYFEKELVVVITLQILIVYL